jgi:hypothetical protein
MTEFTPQVLREGRQRLVEWFEEAQERAKGAEFQAKLSPLAEATFSTITVDNIHAVVIYPAPKGGWHADVLLENVPPGVSTRYGSQVEYPLATREEAEKFGKTMLASIIALVTRGVPKSSPVFLLHGYRFKLFEDFLETGRRIAPDGYGSELKAVARIEETLERLCPGGFDPVSFNEDWSHDDKASLLAVLHTAVLTGVFRYPLREHGEPGNGGRD